MHSQDSFWAFWSDPPNKRDDAARAFITARDNALKALADLRIRTVALVRPINNGKAWVVGFDPDKIDEAAGIAAEMSNLDGKLKSISYDVDEFHSVTGGVPVISELVAERNALLKRVLVVEKRAAEALKAALGRDPHTSPAVLMQRNDVSEAYSALEKAKAETSGPIEDLNEKIGKLNAILEKYRA